jgi:hypothetical protein
LQENTTPPSGLALLIDPRHENPLDYLFLDTENTFKFVPFGVEGLAKRKASYTIEVLGLNSRNYLVKARKNAFFNFRARLREYVSQKKLSVPPQGLAPLIASLRSEHHQIVWHEMIRQRNSHPELQTLFQRAPEALDWIPRQAP